MGIEPDGILGHSFGEMAAGYGDGCMTLEETMLSAYYRTLSIVEQKFDQPGEMFRANIYYDNKNMVPYIAGAMAAIGLTWEETKKRVPPGIVAACHNGKDSVTISGDKPKVQAFVDELKAQGIFAKEVNSAGIAFHSDCMKPCAKPMKDRLEKVGRV